MLHHALVSLCVLTLSVLTLAYPTPTVTVHTHTVKKHVSPAVYPAKAVISPHKSTVMHGYAPGGVANKVYGGAYGPAALPGYGGAGFAGPYGGKVGPYGLGAGHMYGKSAGYAGLGPYMAAGKMGGGYNSLYMLQAMKTIGAKAGGYMNQYGMYPALNKQYGAVASHMPAYLGSGGMYGKYAGGGAYMQGKYAAGTYMKHAGMGLGGYGQGYAAGYMTPYGGKQMGAYGPMGYTGAAVVHSAKQAVPGYYGSVNMLGKSLTPYG